MPATFAVKAAAFVVFVLAIGGAVYGVQAHLGGADALSSNALKLDAARPLLNATAGHTVTFAVIVQNRGDTAVDASITISGSALASTGAGSARVPAGASMTAFVPVDVPATLAPGSYSLDVSVASGDGKLTRARSDLLTLRVLSPSVGFDDASNVDVLYTGRLASNGKVFNTNDPALLPLNFPKTDQYQPSQGALPVQGSVTPQVVQGFYNALKGIEAGESRTVTIPAALAYGPASVQQTMPRTETLERNYDLPIRVESVARATFDSYMNDTNQTGPFEPGHVFYFLQGPNHWPYKITQYDAQSVGYEVDVSPGQVFTLYPFWTNASVVQSVNATDVLFHTTPTTKVGDAFTMRAYWPDMTTLESVNDTTIVVKHSPPVGFKYTQPASQFQQAQDETVRSVNDTAIVVSSPSTNPLAGQDLTFDILALDVTK